MIDLFQDVRSCEDAIPVVGGKTETLCKNLFTELKPKKVVSNKPYTFLLLLFGIILDTVQGKVFHFRFS